MIRLRGATALLLGAILPLFAATATAQSVVSPGSAGGVASGASAGLAAGGMGAAAPDLSIASEEVIRQNYFLGPGDGLLISLWGDMSKSWPVVVSPEGYVVIPPAGEIYVGGMTLAEADRRIAEGLRPFYKNVRIQTTLTTLRRFEVFVLGEVKVPGRYIAHALTNASTIVQTAGGVTEIGSTRNIRIRKPDGREIPVDIQSFLLLGDRAGNPFLTEGDRVVVPVAPGDVEVNGHVGRPGKCEWTEGERVLDYIRLAGGAMEGALLERVELFQFDPETGRTADSVLCDLRDSNGIDPERNPLVRNGDQIFVRSLPEYLLRRTVTIDGEVVYPGEYAIREGKDTLADLVRRAGGVTRQASLHEAVLIRQTEKETVDREYERLKLIPVADMTEDEYEYYKLKSRERTGRVVVDFQALLEENDREEDLFLVRQDRIHFPRRKNVINVSGQVANPGGIEYRPGGDVSYYIETAGGFGWRARKGKTRVIRARTGEWLYAKNVKELEPGDTIWVPEEPQRDWWALFKDTMQVAAQIATVYLVIDRASN